MCEPSGNWPNITAAARKPLGDEELRQYFLYLAKEKKVARRRTDTSVAGSSSPWASVLCFSNQPTSIGSYITRSAVIQGSVSATIDIALQQ